MDGARLSPSSAGADLFMTKLPCLCLGRVCALLCRLVSFVVNMCPPHRCAIAVHAAHGVFIKYRISLKERSLTITGVVFGMEWIKEARSVVPASKQTVWCRRGLPMTRAVVSPVLCDLRS